MKILVTGATGFVGRRLVTALAEQGHEILALSRDVESARAILPIACQVVAWNPFQEPRPEDLEGVDAVMHLAGHPVAGGRWSPAVKKLIRDSRTVATKNLVAALKKMQKAPQVFISASAIGYYGDRGEEVLNENSSLGTGFLPDVCMEWEQSSREHGISGMRWAALRIGIVLGRDGGALEKMLPPFAMGAGGPLGNGRQWMSWIHLDDVVGLFIHVLNNKKCEGIFNAVAPHPETNAGFTKELGKALCRPAFFPVPGFVIKIGFGEMATILLGSSKVFPERALQAGYPFKYATLPEALKALDLRNPDAEFVSAQFFPKPVGELFPFFTDPYNLEKITPPFLSFKVLKTSTPQIGEGTEIDYKLKLRGLPIRWRSRIEEWRPGVKFVDVQLRGPYARWYHRHEFIPVAGGTLAIDRVSYRLPMGYLGKIVAGKFVAKDVAAIFAYRRKVLQEMFG